MVTIAFSGRHRIWSLHKTPAPYFPKHRKKHISFYIFSSHTNQPVADLKWQYYSKDLPKLKYFRLKQNFELFIQQAGCLWTIAAWCVWIISVHIPVPCLRLQLESGGMGLKELRVLHWQSLAELGLKKNKQVNKHPNKNTFSAWPHCPFHSTTLTWYKLPHMMQSQAGLCQCEIAFLQSSICMEISKLAPKPKRGWCFAFHFRFLLQQGQLCFISHCTGWCDHKAQGEKASSHQAS